MFVESLQRDVERRRVEEFVERGFAPGVVPPFSFRYDGRSSGEFLADWEFSRVERGSGEQKAEYDFVYAESPTGLEVRCRLELFREFPAVEWVVTFVNRGGEDTALIEDVQALDTGLTRHGEGEFILHRALGSSGSRVDFAPVDQTMPPSSRVRLAPVGGRSSNTTAFPFFNVEAVGEGVVVGIGWSGQWAAELERDGGDGMSVRAGMERTRLRLHAGEEIRTPRILMLFWTDEDRMRGHNMLRRFILAHHTPLDGDEPVTMPLACSGSGLYAVANEATEENQIVTATRFAELGIEPEYYWLDAGWFEGYWPNGVGNFFPRKDGFPRGLRPLSDAVRGLGMDFILWLEPERVYRGTQVDTEHPDWVLRVEGSPNGVLNLGHPEARQWVTDEISTIVQRDGVTIYREDYNINPLRFWREADEDGREGITEIRWVQGLYQFWDDLRDRNPHLLIDNCASGGRCIDLERVSRSIPLWRTDYAFFPGAPGPQSHTHGLHYWLPCSATGTVAPETYDFRSAMGPGMVLGWRPEEPNFPEERARALIAEFKEARPYFYGDYYPLTPHSINDDVWMAYQFHRIDLRSGIFLAFRRPNCLETTAILRLGGLTPESRYEITYRDTGEKETFTGSELASGIKVSAESAPASILAMYRELT